MVGGGGVVEVLREKQHGQGTGEQRQTIRPCDDGGGSEARRGPHTQSVVSPRRRHTGHAEILVEIENASDTVLRRSHPPFPRGIADGAATAKLYRDQNPTPANPYGQPQRWA